MSSLRAVGTLTSGSFPPRDLDFASIAGLEATYRSGGEATVKGPFGEGSSRTDEQVDGRVSSRAFMFASLVGH